MKVSRLASLAIVLSLTIVACNSTDSDGDSSHSPSPTTSDSEGNESVPESTNSPGSDDATEPVPSDTSGSSEPGSEPTPTEPPPGMLPSDPPHGEDEEILHGDTGPWPNGYMPPQVIPFGTGAYRSTMITEDGEPFQWEPTLLNVECGTTDPRDLNETYSEDLKDPLFLQDGTELCAVTIQYENIGNLPGVPNLPEGVIIDDVLHEQSSDPALKTINDLKLEFALREPLAPGVTVEVETVLLAPADGEVKAIYFGPDASEVEVWLLTE